MTHWTAGYVAEIDCTQGYYRELSPPILSLAVLNRAVATRAGRPFRYLELGYGEVQTKLRDQLKTQELSQFKNLAGLGFGLSDDGNLKFD